MANSAPSASAARVASYSNRLAALRHSLKADGLHAYLVPVQDESLGETPPPHRQRLTWLCGFSGSAGWAILTPEKATLMVDGRYSLQASQQFAGTEYEVHNSADLPPMEWLARALEGVDAPKIGYDARLIAHAQAERWDKILEKALKRPALWTADTANRIDVLWNAEGDRPTDPLAPAFAWKLEYAGHPRAEKEKLLRAELEKAGLDAFLLTNPESPCWLLNLRGADLPTTPQLNCTALIAGKDAGLSVQLFVAPEKISEALMRESLAGVEILPEAALYDHLKQLPASLKLGVDAASTSRAATLALDAAGIRWKSAEDPCLLPRACKHPVEQAGMREAHRRDGLAEVQFLHWLETHLLATAADAWPTEVEIGEKLLSFRAQQPDFWGPSFDTIAGYGPHGAIVHYRAEEATTLRLAPGSLLLLDSGGQYPMGTTDITRTLWIGGAMDAPPESMQEHFTRVLAGHIALGRAKFPAGTTGSQLDALARMPLWEAGLDFDHGTGHGVGTFLNVHEGPQRISKRAGDTAALKPGMVVSNEPGYYLAGQYGIRIESLVLVRAVISPSGGEKFLDFETLTCVPIDRRLILPALLDAAAREWLNGYHAWVWESLQADLPEGARAWLAAACEPI